jgi:anti-sigma B factor antagonist
MSEELHPKPFACEVETRGDAVFLRPQGELDMSTAPGVEEQMRAALASGARRVVVDLRGLSFMDSTGLTLVTRWNNESRRDSFELALVPGVPRVMRLFDLTGLAAYFTFVSG